MRRILTAHSTHIQYGEYLCCSIKTHHKVALMVCKMLALLLIEFIGPPDSSQFVVFLVFAQCTNVHFSHQTSQLFDRAGTQ